MPKRREPEPEEVDDYQEDDDQVDADENLDFGGGGDDSGSESEDDGMESVSAIIARMQRNKKGQKKSKSASKALEDLSSTQSLSDDFLPADLLASVESQRKKKLTQASKSTPAPAPPSSTASKPKKPKASLHDPVVKDGFKLVVLKQNTTSVAVDAPVADAAAAFATQRLLHNASVRRAPLSRSGALDKLKGANGKARSALVFAKKR